MLPYYILSSIGIVVAVLGGMYGIAATFSKHFNNWFEARVTRVVTPFLTNGDKTVANYAHEARDAAQAAQDAAVAAKMAALEARDVVLQIKETQRQG